MIMKDMSSNMKDVHEEREANSLGLTLKVYDYNSLLSLLTEGYRNPEGSITCSNLYPKSCNHKRISLYYLLISV